MAELSVETIDAIAIAVKDKIASSPDPAALLGSASEIWVLIVLIIPGFIAFKIIDWIIRTGKDFGQFQSTLYSLALSLGIFFVVASMVNATNPSGTPFDSLQQIRSSSTDPVFVATMFGFGVLFGLIGGGITKLVARKNFSRNAWDQFADRNLGEWVVLHVSEGTSEKKYSGWVRTISTGKEKKDVVLGSPAYWDETKSDWKKINDKEMLFTELVIKKIEQL